MDAIKRIGQRVPGVPHAYRWLQDLYRRRRWRLVDAEVVFTEIYRNHAWPGTESVSGEGAELVQTAALRRELPRLCADLGVQTMLDLPCGDFNWMRHVHLDGVTYIGADLVHDLIRRNEERYAREGRTFTRLNLLRDDLPHVDLVFCRDCLVHLCFADVFSALHNICRSKSTYLLTTTFSARDGNVDITTGEWRTLNLERAPFLLPSPLRCISEECTEGGGIYRDKALGVWRIDDVRRALAAR
jgi:hypothetical protein